MLDNLIEWGRQYQTRDDEYGMMRHRSVFNAFDGPKREFVSVVGYRVDRVGEIYRGCQPIRIDTIEPLSHRRLRWSSPQSGAANG